MKKELMIERRNINDKHLIDLLLSAFIEGAKIDVFGVRDVVS